MLSRHFFLLLAPNGGVPLFISLGKAICPLLCGTIGQAGDPVVPALALRFGLASLVLPELHTQCVPASLPPHSPSSFFWAQGHAHPLLHCSVVRYAQGSSACFSEAHISLTRQHGCRIIRPFSLNLNMPSTHPTSLIKLLTLRLERTCTATICVFVRMCE